MPKDRIEIRCPNCGGRTSTGWPTTRERHAEITCTICHHNFPLAEAVERTVAGARDRRDPHLVEEKKENPSQ